MNNETLIETLRSMDKVESTDGVRATYKNLCLKAADAIEDLLKERDELKRQLAKSIDRELVIEKQRDQQNKEFNKAINFSLDTEEGLEFLKLWREGCTPEILEEWPEWENYDA